MEKEQRKCKHCGGTSLLVKFVCIPCKVKQQNHHNKLATERRRERKLIDKEYHKKLSEQRTANARKKRSSEYFLKFKNSPASMVLMTKTQVLEHFLKWHEYGIEKFYPLKK